VFPRVSNKASVFQLRLYLQVLLGPLDTSKRREPPTQRQQMQAGQFSCNNLKVKTAVKEEQRSQYVD
jgi:hypothetical protein